MPNSANALHERIVAITGASAGVGRAAAMAFARHGAHVALIARGSERLAAARREIETGGGVAIAVQADVADPDLVFAAADRIERELGPIDVWVNNAMATVFAPVEAVSPDEARRATEVTYLGSVYGTMAALERMRQRRRGTILQIGSALAYRAIPLQAAYCGAKHALRGFTDSLRCELIHDKMPIRVTMIHLPAVNTPQFDWSRNHFSKRPQPVPPIYQPELAADAIVMAALHNRREVWLGAPTYKTIIANAIAPGLLDRILAHSAWQGQLTDADEPQNRADNLFHAVSGSFGIRGRFDARARERSLLLSLSRHRSALGLCAAALLIVAALLLIAL